MVAAPIARGGRLSHECLLCRHCRWNTCAILLSRKIRADRHRRQPVFGGATRGPEQYRARHAGTRAQDGCEMRAPPGGGAHARSRRGGSPRSAHRRDATAFCQANRGRDAQAHGAIQAAHTGAGGGKADAGFPAQCPQRPAQGFVRGEGSAEGLEPSLAAGAAEPPRGGRGVAGADQAGRLSDIAPTGAAPVLSSIVLRKRGGQASGKLERVMGIEPTLSAWEAEVLPLNYTRARPALLRVRARRSFLCFFVVLFVWCFFSFFVSCFFLC